MKETEAPLTSKLAWAADFPVDRVEAQHVARREFAKYLIVVSGGACRRERVGGRA
jgi:hypothetical protein